MFLILQCISVTIRRVSEVEEWYRGVVAKGLAQMEWCYKGKVLTHLWILRFAEKTPQGKDLQPEILTQWHSTLKWALREVQPGSSPSYLAAELPSPVLPGLTRSFPQVLNQWFRPWLNSYHTVGLATTPVFLLCYWSKVNCTVLFDRTCLFRLTFLILDLLCQ